MTKAIKVQKRIRRHKRVRAKISGTAKRPRLCVFRSNKHIYTQIIDDEANKTLAAANDLQLKSETLKRKNNTLSRHPEASDSEPKDLGDKVLTAKAAVAFEVGKLIAQKALKKKIKQVIFDRGGYKYHGRVKALAQGAREGGLKF